MINFHVTSPVYTPVCSPYEEKTDLTFPNPLSLGLSSSCKRDCREEPKGPSFSQEGVFAIRPNKDDPLRGVGSCEDELLHVGTFRRWSLTSDWLPHGKTTVFFKDEEQWTPCYKGPRCYGAFPVLDLPKDEIRKQLGNPLFLFSLLGSSRILVYDCTYFAGVLAFYLRENGYRTLSQSIGTLYKEWLFQQVSFGNKDKKIQYVKKIFQDIHKREMLLPYGDFEHATLLKATQPNSDHVHVTIYDSNGIFDEEVAPKKMETAVTIQIPSSFWTYRLVVSITEWHLCEEGESYSLFTSIKGARKIVPKQPLLQSSQKSENCALECLFAYLKNTMREPAYTRFRLKLFRDCQLQLQLNHSLSSKQKQEFSQELERKISKRMSKLSTLF